MDKARQGEWLAGAALVAACLFWAGNFVTGRAIRGQIDPETLNLLRWLVAAVAFLPLTGRALWAHGGALWRHRLWIGFLGLTGVVGFQEATYRALTLAPVASAALLLSVTPLLILLASAALGQGRLGARQTGAVALSLLGVAVLLGDGDPAVALRLELGAGELWQLAAVASWTAYTLALRARPPEISPELALMGAILAALPVLAALALWQGHTRIAALPLSAWAAVGYVGIFASLAAFSAWGYGVQRKGPAAAGLYINLIPVLAALLAWLVLGEAVTFGQVAGAAVILAALVLGGSPRRRA